MTKPRKNHLGVIVAALVIVFLPVVFIEYRAMQLTGGTFMYPLDDVFIHLTIARNLAEHGNWGINPTEFGSASSSILYTVVLAFFIKIIGSKLFIPLLINCIAGVLIIFSLQRWLQKEGVRPLWQVGIFLAIAILTPLPHIIISGMEHTLQCLLAMLFIFRFADWLQTSNKKLPVSLPIYGALSICIRYEGLFMVGIACLILLFHRRVKQGFLLGALAILPIVLFGLYSVSKGSYFLPNSVLVKSESMQMTISGIIKYFVNIVLKLTVAKEDIATQATQRLLLILPLTYLLFAKQLTLKYRNILIILTGCTLAHLALAATGWFYRYEGYLIFCTIIIVGTLFHQYKLSEKSWEVRGFVLVLAFIIVMPVVLRSGVAYSKSSRAMVNIYEQQFQMARFLEKYYKNDMVAANDIGAISYYTNGKILDLWGLASIDVAKSRKKNYWTGAFLDSMARTTNTKIAIVYDSWFNEDVLHRWKKVGTWTIGNNVICGDSIVSFYAIDSSAGPALQQRLKAFQSELPETVKYSYE